MCIVDDEEIESINSLKLLGVVLDNKLNFSEHVKFMCSKANYKIGSSSEKDEETGAREDQVASF